MPPRKRKAAASKLVAISENESPAKNEVKEDGLAKIDEAVSSSCQSIMMAARDMAAEVRSDCSLQLLKLPKKVREMSVSQFFGLNEADAQGTVLSDLLSRLNQMLLTGPGAVTASQLPPGAGSTSQLPPVAGSTSQLPPQATSGAEPDAPRTARSSRQTVSRVDQSKTASHADSRAAILAAKNQENTASAAPDHPVASPPDAGPRPPAIDIPAAAARTPMVPVNRSRMLGTPAMGTAGGLPPNTSALAGFTLMKKTVMRGRRQAGGTENSIMISTQDGQQFFVDSVTGLANVPAQSEYQALNQASSTRVSASEHCSFEVDSNGRQSPAPGLEAGCSSDPASDYVEMNIDSALEAVQFGRYHVLLFCYSGLVWFSDALEVMLLSFLGPAAACEWNLSPDEESLLTSVVFFGMMIGAWFWGGVADSLGRKTAFAATAIWTAFFGLASALSYSFVALLIFRTAVGFGLAGAPAQYTLFMEWLPPSLRGRWTMGSVIGSLLALWLSNAHG
eukprot:gene23273-30503_t